MIRECVGIGIHLEYNIDGTNFWIKSSIACVKGHKLQVIEEGQKEVTVIAEC